MLRHKYDPVIRLMHQLGVQVQTVDLDGGKLRLVGCVPATAAGDALATLIAECDSSAQFRVRAATHRGARAVEPAPGAGLQYGSGFPRCPAGALACG